MLRKASTPILGRIPAHAAGARLSDACGWKSFASLGVVAAVMKSDCGSGNDVFFLSLLSAKLSNCAAEN